MTSQLAQALISGFVLKNQAAKSKPAHIHADELRNEPKYEWEEVSCTVKGPEENKEQRKEKNPEPFSQAVKQPLSQAARRRVKILSDQVHIIGLVNIHSFLRYSEG